MGFATDKYIENKDNGEKVVLKMRNEYTSEHTMVCSWKMCCNNYLLVIKKYSVYEENISNITI